VVSPFGALRMRSVRTGVLMAEPWWRLIAYCPRCAKRYVRGRPEWTTCLGCEVNPKWTLVVTAEFFAKAKKVFPGSVELPLPVRGEPDHDRGGDHDHDDDSGQMELAA
jgi:hypothetical protein